MVMVVGSASAQTVDEVNLILVNGVSDQPVDVTVNGVPGASELEFANASDPAYFPAGDTVVDFGGTAEVSGPLPSGSAFTVVSGFGIDTDTAFPYPTPLDPIAAGMAKVSVWNATTTSQDIAVNGSLFAAIESGDEAVILDAADGDTITVEADGQSLDVTVTDNSYTSVFVVNDGTTTGLAAAVIPSVQDVIDYFTPADPTVPDVAGQSAVDATTALEAAGYVVSQADQASDTVDVGLVISTNPAAGTQLGTGETVTINVSSGVATVTVPDVVGLSVDEATAQLEAAGLVVTTEEQASTDVEAGTVIETNPRAGVDVAAGSDVIVTVSSGPEDVTVPDLAGLTADEATEVAEAAGLIITIVDDPDDPDPDGIVIQQDPAAGDVVPAGTEVTVDMSPATQDPWTSIKLDPDRILTAGGINFDPGSTSRVEILTTELAAEDAVGDNGNWVIEIDTNELDPSVAYAVLVTGTAEDGSSYEQTFTMPPPGETVDEPAETESSGLPWWVWLVIAVAVVAVIVIGAMLLRGREDAQADDEPAATDSSQADDGGSTEVEQS